MTQVFKPTRVITPTNQTLPKEGYDYSRSGIKLNREKEYNPVKVSFIKNEDIKILDLN